MDFGVVSLDTLVGPTQSSSSPEPTKPKLERSVPEEPDWRASKVAKTTMPLLSQEMVSPVLLRSNHNSLLFPCAPTTHVVMGRQNQEQMISFSSNNKDGGDNDGLVLETSAHISALPYYQRIMPTYPGGLNTTTTRRNVHVGLNGVRGPFTASQWIELEHQALIYKYITSNVPVPSNLILPLKKSSLLNPFAFPSSSLPPSSFGWGSFHVGDSMDPEPGRCRRTDGKKWRCSRDAVADQKYCERHINRGRHRSRKPVEGQHLQTGHTPPSPITSAPINPPPPHRMQSRPKKPSDEPSLDATKHPQPASTFGLVSSDSLLNPSSLDASYHHHPMQHRFIDNWPKDPTRETKPEWTQLSMSIPTTASDNNNLAVSPLRLAHEFEPPRQPNWVPISWGGGGSDCSMMGGPLGEVLTNTSTSSSSSGKNTASLPSLNLLTEGWDGSTQLGTSPTGVLQKSAFCSLSNSSSGSSPRADNNNHPITRKINVFDQVLGSTLA